jgi:hypothetical protein
MDQSKWVCMGYNLGTKDREGESWKTEEQMVGGVQGDDWWTVHTPGTN